MDTESKQRLLTERVFSEMRDTFFFQVHRIQKAIFRKGNQIFQEANITLQMEQFPILLTVHALDGQSQQEIAAITRRDKSSIQRTLGVLEKKGLVKIEQDTTDKRRNLIFITPEGKSLAEKVKKILKQAEEETFSVLSKTEREAAIATIKEVADKLEL